MSYIRGETIRQVSHRRPDTRRDLGETVRLYESLATTLALPLSGLTRRDTRGLVARRLATGQDLTPLSDLCHEKTAGSPLYLTRLLDDLLEKGASPGKTGSGPTISPTSPGWRSPRMWPT